MVGNRNNSSNQEGNIIATCEGEKHANARICTNLPAENTYNRTAERVRITTSNVSKTVIVTTQGNGKATKDG